MNATRLLDLTGCLEGFDAVSAGAEEPGAVPAGSAIYKKNSPSGPAAVDTMPPAVDTERVKLNDAQPDTAANADNVSYLCQSVSCS